MHHSLTFPSTQSCFLPCLSPGVDLQRPHPRMNILHTHPVSVCLLAPSLQHTAPPVHSRVGAGALERWAEGQVPWEQTRGQRTCLTKPSGQEARGWGSMSVPQPIAYLERWGVGVIGKEESWVPARGPNDFTCSPSVKQLTNMEKIIFSKLEFLSIYN